MICKGHLLVSSVSLAEDVIFRRSVILICDKENPMGFIKIHLWKSLQGLILNPFETKNAYKNDKTVPKYWEK